MWFAPKFITPWKLETVLETCHYNIDAAAEAILCGETMASGSSPLFGEPQNQQKSQSVTIFNGETLRPTIATLPPDVVAFSPTRKEAQPSQPVTEQAQIERALEQSMAPENRGLDYLSDDELALIMNDPVFLASLDSDLKSAVELQTKLEAAEAEWQSLEQQQMQRKAFRKLKSAVQNHLAGTTKVSTLAVRARSKLGLATDREASLAQQLEAINCENANEQERRAIRLQARQAMMETIRQHFCTFRSQQPAATYKDWILELHPENANQNLLLTELDKTIDHRFYVEESEHLLFWNAHCDKTGDVSLKVAPRFGPSTANHQQGEPPDLLC